MLKPVVGMVRAEGLVVQLEGRRARFTPMDRQVRVVQVDQLVTARSRVAKVLPVQRDLWAVRQGTQAHRGIRVHPVLAAIVDAGRMVDSQDLNFSSNQFVVC